MLKEMSSSEIAEWVAYFKAQADDEKNKKVQGGMMNKLKKRFKK